MGSKKKEGAPEALLALALEAIAAGARSVSLGHESLGWELPAPIGWQLVIGKVQDWHGKTRQSNAPTWLRVSAQPGDEGPTAYVGDREESGYWDLKRVREWLAEPLPDEGEGMGSWEPLAGDDPVRLGLAHDAELISAAWRAGWEVASELRVEESRSMREHGFEVPVMVAVSLSASNWHYNEEGHEAHRSTGAPVSRGVGRTRAVDNAPTPVAEGAGLTEVVDVSPDGSRHYAVRPVPIEKAVALLASAPWRVGFATYVEESEDEDGRWVIVGENGSVTSLVEAQ